MDLRQQPSSWTKEGGTYKDTQRFKAVSDVHILVSFRVKCVCKWTNAAKLIFIV